jgi:hypothetical protein
MPERPKEQVQDLVKLLRFVFTALFCEDEDIPPQRRGTVLPVFFCGWVDSFLSHTSVDDELSYCERAEVPAETWEAMATLIRSGSAPEQLQAVWYLICLSHNTVPKYPVDAICMTLIIKWADGTIWPIVANCPKELAIVASPDSDAVMNEALAMSLLANQLPGLYETILTTGFDAAHDHKNIYRRAKTPEDPIEVMFGLVLQQINNLRPELRQPVLNAMRLAQGMLLPPITPEARARIEQLRQQAQDKRHGGFDVG